MARVMTSGMVTTQEIGDLGGRPVAQAYQPLTSYTKWIIRSQVRK